MDSNSSGEDVCFDFPKQLLFEDVPIKAIVPDESDPEFKKEKVTKKSGLESLFLS